MTDRKSSKRALPVSVAEQVANLERAGMLAQAAPAGPPDRLGMAMGLARNTPAVVTGHRGALEPNLGALPIEDEAYALKLAGHAAVDIANHLTQTRTAREGKVLSESDVEVLIVTATQRRRRALGASVSDRFQVELDRVEKLIGFLWPQCEEGNVNAIDRVTKLMARNAALLGLDSAEVRLNVNVSGNDMDYSRLSTDELRLLRELMGRAQSLNRGDEKTVEGVLAERKGLTEPKG